MATHTFDLKHGLKVGEDMLKAVKIKDSLTAGEIRQASEASEIAQVVQLPGKDPEPFLLISPTRMASECTRRQILSIGDIEGPISMAMMDSLDEDDINIIQENCDIAQKLKLKREEERRGRTDPAG